jgi:hypothetical protein
VRKQRVGTQRVRHSLGTQYMQTRASQLGVQQWPQRHMQSAQDGQSGGMFTGWRR